jgi:hypothetical protein
MEFRFLGNSGLKVSAISYGNRVTHGSQVEVDVAAVLRGDLMANDEDRKVDQRGVVHDQFLEPVLEVELLRSDRQRAVRCHLPHGHLDRHQ